MAEDKKTPGKSTEVEYRKGGKFAPEEKKTWFQRNQRYFFVGIILMLALALSLPYTVGGPSTNPVVATVLGKKITQNQARSYDAQWEQLIRLPVNAPSPSGENRTLSAAEAVLGLEAAARIASNNELFMMLAVEAEATGVRASNDNVEEFLRNQVVLPDNLTVEQESGLKVATANLLGIRMMFNRTTSAVKVTQPLMDVEMARRFTVGSVRLVEYTAGEFRAGLPTPSEAELDELFKKYADVEKRDEAGGAVAEAGGSDNPYGFGYKLPAAVKLQYVGFSESELQRVVRESKDDYTWEVEARKYYLANKAEFSSKEAGSDVSVPKPFEEVKETVLTTLRREAERKLAERLRSRLLSRLSGDYVAWRDAKKANPDGKNIPVTRSGVSYDAPEYFSKLAGELGNEFGVSLSSASLMDGFKSRGELRLVPGIGGSILPGGVAFSTYATTRVAGLVDAAKPAEGQGKVLELMEPSPMAIDPVGGQLFVFRVVETRKAAAPASRAEVAAQVEEDFKTLAAKKQAAETAGVFVKKAKEAGLDAAANVDGRLIRAVPEVSLSQPILTGVATSAASQQDIADALTNLMAEKQAGRPAVAAVELPADRKVLVLELTGTKSVLGSFPKEQLMMATRGELRSLLASTLVAGWFDAEETRKRTNFKVVGGL